MELLSVRQEEQMFNCDELMENTRGHSSAKQLNLRPKVMLPDQSAHLALVRAIGFSLKQANCCEQGAKIGSGTYTLLGFIRCAELWGGLL